MELNDSTCGPPLFSFFFFLLGFKVVYLYSLFHFNNLVHMLLLYTWVHARSHMLFLFIMFYQPTVPP